MSGQVTKYCKTDRFSCKKLLDELKRDKEKLDKLRDQLRQLKHKSGEDRNASAIQAVERNILEVESNAKNRKVQAGENLETAAGCFHSRKSVMTLFSNVKAKVNGEGDKALKPYVEQLVKKYQKSYDDHEEALDNAEDAMETCKEAKSLSL